MKRRPKLFTRILLPTLLILLLLPPLSCFIFSRAANRYAYTKAGEELTVLRKNVLPLMRSAFPVQAAGDDSRGSAPDSDYAENRGDIPAANIKAFLGQLGPVVRRMGGDAKLIILSGELQIVYPRDEAEKSEIAPLAKDLVDYIYNMGQDETGELNASDGESYLVSVYQIPTKSVQLKYLVTYCSTSQASAWVQSASLLVLVISSVLALLAIAVLWFTAHSVTKPLGRLCKAASGIGEGSFAAIEPGFSLQEPEELRIAMNRMSAQLQRADESQKSFFQNVSHELRNPLMSISGYAQGIEQEVFSSPKEAAHTIMVESARLTELVSSLLTLSRMENDPQKPQLSAVRIIDPLEDCLDRMNGLALKRNVSLTLSPFDRRTSAWCEEELLCRTMDNLLTNAIRYAEAAVSISVNTDGRRVQISVSDDGAGIAEKDLPHIFERCYKGAGGNFGIGLAISLSAAQKMEGSLTAANKPAGGAVFVLSLKAQE